MSRDVMQQALDAIQNMMEMAFHERYPVCCGQGHGGECCGSPVEAWPEWAQKVMDGLADSQRALSAELAKSAAVPDAWQARMFLGGKWGSWSATEAPDDPSELEIHFAGSKARRQYRPLYASPQPSAPAVSPVDVKAVRERIESLEYAEKWLGLFFKEAWSAAQAGKIGRHRESLSTLRLELARAIGDEK